ncbi:hypothetical protein Ssi03_51130 [Sphaerisporangium siamense]|uniref:Uncharacterized protein n=1 Tax=Sphaerisporangium siamense TaxID=795645 RepID=A0A7W7DB80_9ACTN|nr:hypothetical protein [Sphaerisporangium siamense]MBB4702183.1 hypothetical protein [Sphaerisporangium siamense]GII87123.1 hypothetical protein Ssi03_51130 [Sphaerisporangium siamense]
MKISTVAVVTLVTAAAWAPLIIEFATPVEVLDVKLFTTALAVGLLAPTCGVMLYLVTRIEAALWANAARVETALDRHAKLLKEQILTVERFFSIGIRSKRIAEIQADEMHGPADTGPFSPWRN